MNVKLPKEKLLQVVEDMTKNVMQNAAGGKVDMLHLAKLKSYLMDEIKNGKITNVKQIMQVIDNLSKKDESVNEAGDERFDWPPVLDKFNTKEIQKLEVDYRASLDKSSAILKKQWELINKGYPSKFPWENYDKWPAKLKAEVQKLNSQIDKEREKQPAMFKKLMQARGTWR
jgi:hypothetical protein